MKTLSMNQSASVAGGDGLQTTLALVAAKVSYDFMASAFAGGLGSLLMRNTLNFVAQPFLLNPSALIGVLAGAVGGGLSQQVPSLTHNMGLSMAVGALTGLASYTTNTTNLIY